MAVVVAAQDPVVTLGARWFEAVTNARKRVALLEDDMRELDKIAGQLDEYGVHMVVDLGPVGDHARSAWLDLQDDPDGLPAFVMPR